MTAAQLAPLVLAEAEVVTKGLVGALTQRRDPVGRLAPDR
jgi:hypothetical protein